MKKIIKTVKLFLAAIQWFLGVDKGELVLTNTWTSVPPQEPKKMKVMKDTHSNWLLAMRVNGSNLYNYCIILVNFVRRRTRYGTYYMMMGMPNPNQVVTGYLNFPGPKNENVPHARQMSHDISLSPDITTPVGILAALDTSIDNYAAAHASDLVPTYREMVKQFDAILLIFNLFANELVNRPMAISILQHGGFHVKGTGGSHAAVWGVRTSVISGEMLITVPTLDGCAYEFWYSADGINYERIQGGTWNHRSLGGLTPGHSAWFKYQHIIGNTGQGMSDPIERIVT